MKDACCTDGKTCKWFCPNIVSVVAGFIMVVAGTTKFVIGKAMLAGVGGMVLGLFGVPQGEMATFALVLGCIAATIEILWGISFGLGCCKTSRWAALGLSIVMLFALAAKLKMFQMPEGATGWSAFASVVSSVQVDILLVAVFVKKASRLWRCGSCCGTSCAVAPKN